MRYCAPWRDVARQADAVASRVAHAVENPLPERAYRPRTTCPPRTLCARRAHGARGSGVVFGRRAAEYPKN
ncbi:MAG: hypothetical protein C0483_10520 [Pirellula sp.]|nr:hypothetical protein [Pirellula sp.]